jgi:hypothetical protein
MVFGQGATADYAYDATVMYHEFTHGVVFAWGGFNRNIDALGGLTEPAAVNEGTADSMAVSENRRSEVGAFIGARSNPATAISLPVSVSIGSFAFTDTHGICLGYSTSETATYFSSPPQPSRFAKMTGGTFTPRSYAKSEQIFSRAARAQWGSRSRLQGFM